MTDDQRATDGEHTGAEEEEEEERAPDPETRKAIRENAKRVIREIGIGEMLQTLNRHALQGRGWFEEYDSGVLFKWGTSFTRRHIWVDVTGNQLRFRLNPHLRCAEPVPACDGE